MWTCMIGFVPRIETKFDKGLRLAGDGQVCEIEVEEEGDNQVIDDLHSGVLYRYLRFGCRVEERTC